MSSAATYLHAPASSYPSLSEPPSYDQQPAHLRPVITSSSISTPYLNPSGLYADATPTAAEGRSSLDSTSTSRTKSKLTARVHFLLVFSALCVSSFLSALDLTTVSTALPTIVADLQNDAIRFGKHGAHNSTAPPKTATNGTGGGGGAGGTYIWIGAAYTIAGMSILPWTGGLCEIWGRKTILLTSLFFFLFGSVICGASHSLEMMIIGRALQGIGDGGIISLAEIVVADLVSLSQRGTYEGILGVVWAGASAVGPPIGGVFARKNRWRWLFWLNIPITVVAIVMISCFMNMKTPKTDVKSKLKTMDWTGNAMLIAATVGLGLGLTWGGAKFPWMSAAVLVPLIISVVLLGAFFYLELFKFKHPTVPRALLSNRTSISAHLTSFAHGVITMAIIYVIPTYFQAVKLSSTIMSGWMVLPFSCTVAFTAIGFAVSIEWMQRYVPHNHLGWLFTLLGVPLLLLLNVDSGAATWIGVQIPVAIGCGILFVAPQFPVLASVAVEMASKALALQLFFASFGQTLGIMLAEAVFQSSIHQAIKSDTIQQLAANGSLPFNIEDISSPYSMHFGALRHLTPQASYAVRSVYSSALRHVWILLVPFAVFGWGMCFLMKEIEMHDEVDERFAADVKESEVDHEKGLLARSPSNRDSAKTSAAVVDTPATEQDKSLWSTTPDRDAEETRIEASSSIQLLEINSTDPPTVQHQHQPHS